MATALQITRALAGLNGVEDVRFRFYQTDRRGTVLSDLSPAVVMGSGQVDWDNDRAVPSTITLELDARKLPARFTDAGAAEFNIAPHYQALIGGSWLDFPQGIYWIDQVWQEHTPGTHFWPVQGADLSNALALSVTDVTYVVPAGSDYLNTVNAVLAAQGMASGLVGPQLSTPLDFPWPPNTSWLTICSDLLAGINWYPLFPDESGVLRSRERVRLALDPPAVAYSANDEPAMVIQPFRQMRRDLSQALNVLTVAIDDPLRGAEQITVTNSDPSSPISTTALGYTKRDQLTGGSGTKCLRDIATGLALAEVELDFANARSLPAELHTYPDPRRGGRELYTLSVADQHGAVVANQLYRVQGWTLPLALGATMTHRLQRVQFLGLTL